MATKPKKVADKKVSLTEGQVNIFRGLLAEKALVEERMQATISAIAAGEGVDGEWAGVDLNFDDSVIEFKSKPNDES